MHHLQGGFDERTEMEETTFNNVADLEAAYEAQSQIAEGDISSFIKEQVQREATVFISALEEKKETDDQQSTQETVERLLGSVKTQPFEQGL